MKKLMLLTCLLSLATLTSCGNSSELEALKAENEELKQLLSVTPSPRPLELRHELLVELQNDYHVIEKYMPKITTDTYKDAQELMDVLTKNVKEQSELINGINGEEKYDTLYQKLENLNSEYEKAVAVSDSTKSEELKSEINILLYGNQEGTKTW